jgi:DNA polymerase lambda
MSSINKDLSEKLKNIAEFYVLDNNKFKAKAFRNASYHISNYPTPITSASDARENIAGVGVSIEEIINEYLTTGKIGRLDEFNSKFVEKPKIMELFNSIYGIGPKSADDFYQQGFRTIEDLWFKADLNDSQKLGIIWREHINIRIPRDEMDVINKALNDYFEPHNIKWIIAGSYRRGELTSGDVDILIEKQPNINMDNIISILQNILPATLSKGESKFMGMLRLSDKYNGHRIDIRLIEPNHYPVALLYFTGSKEFNILIRKRALQLGMSLNEYTLTNIPANQIISSEEDIFRILGIEYVAPNERKAIKNDLTLLV